MGNISSICRQYSRKASEVHPPVAATISGDTPARSNSTAPPIRKLWPLNMSQSGVSLYGRSEFHKPIFGEVFPVPGSTGVVGEQRCGIWSVTVDLEMVAYGGIGTERVFTSCGNHRQRHLLHESFSSRVFGRKRSENHHGGC